MNILEACADPNLFRPWFRDWKSWSSWLAVLAAIFGLPMTDELAAIFRQYTGRKEPPTSPSNEAWLCCGRRGGKSFVLALIAVFLACFSDYRRYLAPGERGTVMIIAADRKQARVIFRYIRGLLKGIPLLAAMVQRETQETFDLSNSTTIEVGSASYRRTRGYTLVAALCDEIAFWPTDDAANPDYLILDALRPGMATIPGSMLLCASSPYAKRGALWDAYSRYYGKDASILVWQAPTRAMNPTVLQAIIDKAMEVDPASAAAEYGAEFRSDLESFVPRDVIDAATVPGRFELPPMTGIDYTAFVDPSGGSSDSMTLAVAHRDSDGCAVLDAVRERRPPFSPEVVVTEFAQLLTSYSIRGVTGDRWGGEFVREPFRTHGVEYNLSEKPKSDIYRDFLPIINSGKAELLDLPRLSAQLCGLERRTARGGRDSIDHAPGAHDDVANAVAGALLATAQEDPLAIWRKLV